MKAFHVTTFGCQMNEHDSERMKGMLESLGYREVPERADADLILFNTCSIREKADDRFVAHLHEAKALKRRDPERVIGVGGCWAQSVKEQVFRQFPFVDVAFGPGQVHKLAEFLTSDSLTAQGFFEFEGFTGHLPAKRARDAQAWLQISVGCNMRCSFCIVPSTRGREVSRPLAELVDESRRLVADGVTEITLLGQNVNAYGRDLRPERATFSQLLRELDGIDGLRRLRYTSPHPKDMREDVIRAHAELPTLCEHIHLPLQAGASRILKAMRRPYTRERYMDRVALIREHVPGRRADDRHHRRLPGGDRGRLPRDARGRRGGRLRRRVHVHLLAAPRDRRGDARRPRPARGEGRADAAARRGRPAPRARALAALRRAHARGARRGAVADGPEPAARPHAPQQGRELRRPGAGGRVRRRRDPRGDQPDAAGRAGEPARAGALTGIAVLDPGVLAFVSGALPAPPARVLEVGAGSGELALALVARGYDVIAIDPASEGPPVVPLALHELAEPAASFDAAVAVVSLHHVEPLEESCRRLGELVRPGGTLVVDEFDVEVYDERAARWWLDQRVAAGHDADRDPREMVAELRDHLHSLDRIREALEPLVRARAARPRRVPAPLAPAAGPAGRGGAADRRRSGRRALSATAADRRASFAWRRADAEPCAQAQAAWAGAFYDAG